MADDYTSVYMYSGVYTDPSVAQEDWATIKEAHNQSWIGKYQGALFEHTADGQVKVHDTTSTTRTTGAEWGAGVGAAVGLLFPPGVLASAGLGALIGAGIGNLAKGWSGSEIKELAGMIDPGTVGIVVVAEGTPELGAEKLLARAESTAKHEFKGEVHDIKKALNQDVHEYEKELDDEVKQM